MVSYDWERYRAIKEGETLFARRYDAFQHAAADAVMHLEGRITALEFGTGDGGSTKRFLERLPQARLTCVDTDRDALRTARQQLRGYDVSALTQDFLMMQTRPNDLVFGIFVTHNFPNAQKRMFFRQAYRMLRQKGTLILGDVMTFSNADENDAEWKKDYAMLAQLPQADHEFWKEHFDTYDRPHASSAQWNLAALRQEGFSTAEIKYRDGFWTVVSARK